MTTSPEDFSQYFRIPAWKHQQLEWAEHRDTPARALLWQMRTGKTKAVLDKACYLYETGKIDAILVIAQNGVHTNWAVREMPKHMWESTSYAVHVWRSSAAHGTIADRVEHDQSMNKCLSTRDKLVVLCVNSEALINPRVQLALRSLYKDRQVFLVVDESHDFRTPSSRRGRVARGLTKASPYRTIMTGTVVHNTPLAAWAQYEILEAGALGFTTYTAFKDHYAVYGVGRQASGRTFPRLEGYRDLETLKDKLAYWSSVVLRSDCEDLPKVLRVTRSVGISSESERVYKALAKEFCASLQSGETVNGENAGVRLLKMQQCLSGFVIAENGDTSVLAVPEDDPRMDALMAELGNTTSKVIVWAQFHVDIRRIKTALLKAEIGFVEYHGLVPQGKVRQDAIRRFQEDPMVRVFLGNPKAGGQGLDLSAADVIVWYSHTFDAIVRDQASERATEMGGEAVSVVDLCAVDSHGSSTTDAYVLGSLENKRNISDSLAGVGLQELRRFLEEAGL